MFQIMSMSTIAITLRITNMAALAGTWLNVTEVEESLGLLHKSVSQHDLSHLAPWRP